MGSSSSSPSPAPGCKSRCPQAACHWKLFQNDNMAGHFNDMCQADHDLKEYTGKNSWLNWQFKNDDVSSGTFSSYKAECYYQLYQHSDGSGWRTIIWADGTQCCDYTLADLQAHGFKV